MNLLPPTAIATVIALSIPLAVSAPIERVQSIPVAELYITKAFDANVKAGQRVGVGQTIRTNGPRIINGNLRFGGSVEATLWAWGVRNISLGKSSSLSIKSYALCAGGGRILELNIKGGAYVQTRYLTQSCSAVRVCLGIGKGCVTLRSSAKVREYRPDEYVVGMLEGSGIGQDADQKFPPIPIPAGKYSLVAANGSFSPPKTVQKSKGYRVVTRTKAVQHLQALDGWQIQDGRSFSEAAALPVGVIPRMRSPLD